MADTIELVGVKSDESIVLHGATGAQQITAVGTVAQRGPAGHDGEGIPDGGSANQVLAKDSSIDKDVSWKTADKAFVGLGNVDNTSDLSKPISTATQAALDLKVAKGELVINVKDYGAIGDGVVDDTSSIQTAIDYCFANSRTLYFPKGIYKYAPSSTKTLNNSARRVIWKGDGATINCTTLDIGFLSIFRSYSVQIDGISFVGPNACGSVGSQFAYGLAVYQTNSVRVTNCEFLKFVGDGLLISGIIDTNRANQPQTVVVNSNRFDYTGRGGLTIVGGITIDITNNYIGSNRADISANVTGDAFLGDVLHVEADPSGRYGIENCNISSNVIYGSVDLAVPTMGASYVGDKNSSIYFHHNQVFFSMLTSTDPKTCIYCYGGNPIIEYNEIHITVDVSVTDTVSDAAIRLQCDNARVRCNTITSTGKKLIYQILPNTTTANSVMYLEDNKYIVTGADYFIRAFKIGSFSALKTLNITREDVSRIVNLGYFYYADQGATEVNIRNCNISTFRFIAFSSTTENVSATVTNTTVSSTFALQYPAASTNVYVYRNDSTITGSWDRTGFMRYISGQLNTVTKTANYTASTYDNNILVDASGGSRTINLPAAASAQPFPYTVKKIDSSTNTVTVDASSTELIDGALTKILYSEADSVTLQSDGTSWRILGDYLSIIDGGTA